MSQSAARMPFYFPEEAVANAAIEPSSLGMALPLLNACAFSNNWSACCVLRAPGSKYFF
jgi:hypothetical protein